MGINFSNPLGVGGISVNMPVSRFGFTGTSNTDRFESTSVSRFANENYIKNAIELNPNIKTILKEMNAPVKLNLKELEELNQTHAKDTQNVAGGIITNLPKGLRIYVDVKAVKDAAYLHDIGKVLIPSDILNKNAALDNSEKEIMHRHSELGYEILKNSGLDEKTLRLIKYHHQNPSHSGYPAVPKDFFADLNLQILTAADKYSALTEQRVYKAPMSSQKALAVIYQDVKKGNIHPFVFKALRDYAENSVKNPTQQSDVFVV